MAERERESQWMNGLEARDGRYTVWIDSVARGREERRERWKERGEGGRGEK